MKLLRVVLGVALTGLLPATAATAQPQVIQSRDADRELFAVAGPDGLEVRDGERTVRVELPDGARLASLEALADGWVAAGTRTVDGETGLWLSTGRGDESELLPLPPGVGGRYLNRPVPLIERGRLAGLAWLEGERHDALSVRAAVWSGRSWSEPVTVSPPDLESQLALSGAVLPDGSWQLVWAAVDGADDEIFSARRRIDGNWEARRQLNPPNDVPDILPQIVATDAGSLIAWNELHEGRYRVRLVRRDLERRERIGFVGPAGSVSPRLLAAEGGAVLLYKAVLPDLWTALEVDSDGTPLRMAMAAVPGYGPPVIVSTGAALRFSGMTARPAGAPEAAGEEGVEMEIPWQAFERELLEEVSPAPGAAAGPAGAGGPAQAGAGTVIYRAFGDSIGRGSGDPVAPSIVFDIADDGEAGPPPYQACAPNVNPFAILCGYNWRLEDALNASFAADVANDGKGGEDTVTGLSRIEGVLASGGDVVLIMEGSNDLTGCTTSADTVRNNIAAMVDKATAAGHDTVIASVPKRRRVDTAGNPVPDPCGEDAATTSLKDMLSLLATQKNRAFANVWTAIDPALGQTDYWNAGNGQNDLVGHPDISGYAKISPKFSAPILADSPLGAPNPLTPTGTVGASPTFSWNTTGNARIYRLLVNGPGFSSDTWHDAAICSGNVCSVVLSMPSNGSYTWQAAGRNLRGLGTFSGPTAFEVEDCALYPDSLVLNAGNTGSQTYRTCPGTITTQAGFRVLSTETVVLHGGGGVIFEGIEVEAGADLTVKTD